MTATEPAEAVTTPRSMPTRLADSITAVVIVGYVVVLSVNTADLRFTPERHLEVILELSVIGVLQLLHSAYRTRRFRARFGVATLLLQIAATCLVLGRFGFFVGGIAGFIAGSALLILPTVLAWTVFGLVPLGVMILSIVQHADIKYTVYLTVFAVLTGLIAFSLTRLADLVRELYAAQRELTLMAVTKERLRFSRDLHDLLGYSLSAITLKGELTDRLLVSHADRARRELEEMLRISRQALSDVRTVARGYRDMSLAAEAGAARSVLAAAGIDAVVEVTGEPLSGIVDTVMATVLREGVTNVLRHSKARNCRITSETTAELVRLTVVNDGVRTDLPKPPAADRDGQAGLGGLDNLTARTTAIGGRLICGSGPDGMFRLIAEAPLRPSPPVP